MIAMSIELFLRIYYEKYERDTNPPPALPKGREECEWFPSLGREFKFV